MPHTLGAGLGRSKLKERGILMKAIVYTEYGSPDVLHLAVVA